MALNTWLSNFKRSPLMTGLAMLAASAASLATAHYSGHVASIWLANGVVFATLLSRSRRQLPLHMAAVAAANIALGLLNGSTGRFILMSTSVNISEIWLLLLFTQRYYQHATGKFRISGPRFTLLTLLACAVPILSLAPVIHHYYSQWNMFEVLSNWYMADVLGMLLMVTMASMLRRRSFAEAFRGRNALGTWACLLLVVGGTLAVFEQSHYPLLFMITSLLIFVVFRRGFTVAIFALFLHAILATSLTMAGHGPMALILTARSMMLKVVFLQYYLIITLSTIYPIGRILHKHRRAEELNRLMAVHSRDIISRTSIDGVRQWVSDSVTEVLGWRPEELLGDRTIRVIHPDDAPGMIAVFEKMRNGLTTATLLYRARTRQGTYIPLEGHLRMLREPISGQPHEVVINSRDITDRVAAEEELKAAYAAMQRLAATDPLTGLANRRVFDEMLDREWRRGLREVSPLAVLLFDVDYFKRYNDALGHQAGDECLRIIAHCLADIVQRPGDLTARYGGEEFIALLPGTDVSGAVHIASRIQDALRRQAVPHPDSDCGQHLTLSMGVAALVPHIGMEAVHLVRAADRALYSAKKLGRNRLEIAVSPCDLVQSALTDSADSADSAVADDTATVGND